jgi:hypothetical protein
MFEPGAVFRSGMRDHIQDHVRVLSSAVLGTFPTIGALIVRLDADAIHHVRNHVHFAMQARDPERMNHVVRT